MFRPIGIGANKKGDFSENKNTRYLLKISLKYLFIGKSASVFSHVIGNIVDVGNGELPCLG